MKRSTRRCEYELQMLVALFPIDLQKAFLCFMDIGDRERIPLYHAGYRPYCARCLKDEEEIADHAQHNSR